MTRIAVEGRDDAVSEPGSWLGPRPATSGLRRVGVLLSALLLARGALAQESAHYRTQVTVADIAGRSSSPAYATSIAATRVAGSAGQCPTGLATGLGSWSVLGATQIPVMLMIEKNSGAPGTQSLSWTGQARKFDVYRSASPVDVVSPENLLLTTSGCATTDASSSANAFIFFYRVEPRRTSLEEADSPPRESQ